MRTTVVVIGAGHAGLAVSRLLTEQALDHVVLERGEVANAWRTQRWASLRLLTPNWQTRLPGFAYDGPDPDGYMGAAEVAELITDYARVCAAPVRTSTEVTSLRAVDGGYRVDTTDGSWQARAVVVAAGACTLANLPVAAADVPAGIRQVNPLTYRDPGDVGAGKVLVVGASATGLQLAEELLRAGREVTVAVGEHVRMPRTYLGRDIFYWLERIGRLDERWDEVDDVVRARHVPSPQLAGTPERADLDLNALTSRGAEIVGRLGAVRDGTAYFSGALGNVCRLADLKLNRLLDAIDEAEGVEPGPRPKPTRVDDEPRLAIDLVAEGYETIVWATGFRPDHSWIDLPVFDHKGRIRHDGGVVTGQPGLYVIGLPFLRRRKSTFIHGAEDDARDLVAHLTSSLH